MLAQGQCVAGSHYGRLWIAASSRAQRLNMRPGSSDSVQRVAANDLADGLVMMISAPYGFAARR